MQTILLVVHVMLGLGLIAVILLQHLTIQSAQEVYFIIGTFVLLYSNFLVIRLTKIYKNK